MSWTRHLRPELADLAAYDVPPADPRCARMHANECAEPWPRHVRDAVADAVRGVELGRYPDTSGRTVRALLGRRLGCAPDRVVLGNGSDEIISIVLTALSGGAGTLVIPTPTFVMYRHSARVLGMPVTEVPLGPRFELDDAAMREALPAAAVCFLARPNNPTGNLWDADVIERWFGDFPDTVFVIDEAYAAYAPGASMWRVDLPPNVIWMSTLSKVGGAALRLGYGVAGPRLAAELDKVRHPYNISATSLAIAQLLLERFGDEQAQMLTRSRAARARLAALLAGIDDVEVFPSASNLVLARLRPPERAPALVAHLKAHGVLIKDVSKVPALRGCIRASVGTDAELDRLQAALASFSRST